MGAIGRQGEADDRRLVRGQNSDRLPSARRIDRNAAILAGGRKSVAGQSEDGINRAIVKAEHRASRAGVEIPQDRGLIEAAGNGAPPIRQYSERAHRPAMAAQLRESSIRDEQDG